MSQSNAQRIALHRKRKKAGLTKLPDIWAKPEHHAPILHAIKRIVEADDA